MIWGNSLKLPPASENAFFEDTTFDTSPVKFRGERDWRDEVGEAYHNAAISAIKAHNERQQSVWSAIDALSQYEPKQVEYQSRLDEIRAMRVTFDG